MFWTFTCAISSQKERPKVYSESTVESQGQLSDVTFTNVLFIVISLMKVKWRNWTFSFLLLMSSTILLSQKPQDVYGRLEIWLLWIINGAGSFDENNYILKQCIWQHWLGLGGRGAWTVVLLLLQKSLRQKSGSCCAGKSAGRWEGGITGPKFQEAAISDSLKGRRMGMDTDDPRTSFPITVQWEFDEWVKLVKSTGIRGLKEESISASKTSRHKVKKKKKNC